MTQATALYTMGTLTAALAVDAACGDPKNRFHPVAWFGTLAKTFEERLFIAGMRPLQQLVAGACVVTGGVAVAVGLPMSLVQWLPEPVAFLMAVGALKACFALKSLGEAGDRMRLALEASDEFGAKQSLSHLCSRSAEELDAEELAAATIESLAENLSDSFVAPLFWFCVLGLPGALAYRAINTLDAMFGYRGRYEWFGKVAARLDDVANVVPARATAALLWLAGAWHGESAAQGWRIWRRDAAKTASPNAGQPMAMMAGLLRVRLIKRDAYALGDAHNKVEARTIVRAWAVVRTAAWMAASLAFLWPMIRSHQ